jgi:hypothetical protein
VSAGMMGLNSKLPILSCSVKSLSHSSWVLSAVLIVINVFLKLNTCFEIPNVNLFHIFSYLPFNFTKFLITLLSAAGFSTQIPLA